jgi:branched-subunit amino acid transport protein
VSVELIGLALLIAAATYPSRALPLLAPGMERLPPIVLAYLRLVGPAVLAAFAAIDTALLVDAAGKPSFHVGIEWLAVGVGVALVAWRRNLLLGILAAVALMAIVRAVLAT